MDPLQNMTEDSKDGPQITVSLAFVSKLVDQVAKMEQRFQVIKLSHSAEIESIKQDMMTLAQKWLMGMDVNQQVMLRAAAKEGLGRDFNVQAGILGQLRFEAIDHRIHELDKRPSPAKSYLWLEGTADQTPVNFEAWLGSSEKLYWISGMPGSGKSTLMMYLYSNVGSMSGLTDWVQQRQLLVAAYFFREVGEIALLKTQEGLLRALLSQILRQRPDIISEVYPEIWAFFDDGMPTLWGAPGWEVSLHAHHLLEKLQAVCRSLADRDCCLFLLIDGLDEYEGLINVLTELPNVKVCVASRLENAFLDTYARMANKFSMERYNKPDIEEYVRGRLERYTRSETDEDRNTVAAHLIEEVVSSANGFFLWVRLVVESLEEGFTNRDTSFHLQRRLNQLPKELEQYYDHMLSKVSEHHHLSAASLLLVAYHAHDVLSWPAYWCITEGAAQLDVTADIEEIEWLRNGRRSLLARRLRARCRGLLIIPDLAQSQSQDSLQGTPGVYCPEQKVNFLHRTRGSQQLNAWKPDDFDADVLICKAIRAQIRTSPVDTTSSAGDGPMDSLLDIFDFHWDKLEQQPSQNATAKDLFHGLVQILSTKAKLKNHHTPRVSDLAKTTTSPSTQAINGDTEPEGPTKLILGD
ncbi:hypothetical protein LTR97_008038 [Elasticomyces elasticus]|uniref:NACHT domain-containing protein n=1 Tax=Elasticomyces elasticus TaxID=574655 RepID=A0AAN7W4A4_9PEZI|nr:hypothetical protein LTR97_008038 [Elasticomyces elasticus]